MKHNTERTSSHSRASSKQRSSSAHASKQHSSALSTVVRILRTIGKGFIAVIHVLATVLKPILSALARLIKKAAAHPQGRIVLVVVAIFLALAVFSGIRSCVSPDQQHTPIEQVKAEAFLTNETYDWNNLSGDMGRFVYSVDGQPMSQTGIDVSEHQGEIDWEAVAADGIDFAFIRVGARGSESGTIKLDSYFERNLEGATAAGLEVGVYFFSQAIDEKEAVEEASFTLEQLGDRGIALPVAYDHEPVPGTNGRADDLSIEQMTANAEAFCNRISEAGHASLIYGNSTDLSSYAYSLFDNYGVWYAEYDVYHPSRNSGFIIWQYTNSGSVRGIDKPVDLNMSLLPLIEQS